MAKKNIINVGMELPGTDIESISLKSKNSLLDYDIIIIDPSISEFYKYGYEQYHGKPCLDDTNSFCLKEHLEHWRREILETTKAGKNVFIFLNQEEEVFIATGERSFSGTGRNRQTTRHVSQISNYQIIPGNISVTNSNGSSMSIVEKNSEVAAYWNELEGISEFRVLLEGEDIKPIVKTKTGNKIVGAKIRYKNAEGNLFLMPYISFDDEKYTLEKEGEDKLHWTDEARTLGKKVISNVCSIDKAIRSSNKLSAVPDWISQDKYVLPKEQKIRNKLIPIEEKIEELQKQKEQYEQNIVEESTLKQLIYETGKPLEHAVHSALEVIGFTVSHYEDSDSEFDVIFESNEGRLLGEVEGKDNKAINVDKLRQLEMNIHEDFERDDISEIAKGALIGNAYRLKEPSERNNFFTDKCIKAAQRNGTALIRTDHLFEAVKYLSGKSDKRYAAACRKAILDTTGEVDFPSPPNFNGAIENTKIDN